MSIHEENKKGKMTCAEAGKKVKKNIRTGGEEFYSETGLAERAGRK